MTCFFLSSFKDGPVFTQPPSNTVVGIEGESLQVPLVATANPQSIAYSWTKDGSPIVGSSSGMLLSSSSSLSSLHFYLIPPLLLLCVYLGIHPHIKPYNNQNTVEEEGVCVLTKSVSFKAQGERSKSRIKSKRVLSKECLMNAGRLLSPLIVCSCVDPQYIIINLYV